MAERRMFAKTIIDSDAFLDMPLSAQALYFHLAMRADDDGFVNNPRKIQRMIGASEDDCRLLVAKSYVLTFESGVIVIRHWRLHNYIQKDRYVPTACRKEFASLAVQEGKEYTIQNNFPSRDTQCIQTVSKMDTERIQTVSEMDTQVRIGKVRLVKSNTPLYSPQEVGYEECPYRDIVELFNSTCRSLPKVTTLSDDRKNSLRARWRSGKTIDDFRRLFEKAEASVFLKGANNKNWQATFDWLIKDRNMAKVLDGNYDDHVGMAPKRNYDEED